MNAVNLQEARAQLQMFILIVVNFDLLNTLVLSFLNHLLSIYFMGLFEMCRQNKNIFNSTGFCVKTRSITDDKIFINICQTDSIPNPDDISEQQLVEILQSETPSEFRVPMSIGEPRTDSDRNGKPATIYDIAIHPTFFKKVENSQLFKQFLLTVVFEGIQDKYNITINTGNFIILKNKKAMGNLQLHRIQQRKIDSKMKKEKKLIEEIDIPTTPLVAGLKKDVKAVKKNEVDLKEPPYRLARMINEDNTQFLVGDFYIPDVVSI